MKDLVGWFGPVAYRVEGEDANNNNNNNNNIEYS